MTGPDVGPWLRRLKALAQPLLQTPLHPQWLAARSVGALEARLRALPPGSRVLDVGCASQWPRALLPGGCEYLGLDYPDTAAAYATRAAIHADAHALPLADASVDVVLLLDVLEHLRDPERAMAGLRRVLRPGGQLVVSVPFGYPLHDLPNDYTRWTAGGLRAVAERAGFEVREVLHRGEPVETAALLFNLALAHSVLVAIRQRRPGALLAPLVPPLVLLSNVLGWGLARLLGPSAFLPHAYAAVWTRPAAPA